MKVKVNEGMKMKLRFGRRDVLKDQDESAGYAEEAFR